MASDFRDLQVVPKFDGYPTVTACDDNLVVVTDWQGYCYLINLTSGNTFVSPTLAQSPLIGKCLMLASVDPVSRNRCAVAASTGWASLWNFGSENVRRIYPETNGPANTVTFSPGGDQLAIGLGYYSGGPGPEAAVEFWNVE